MLVSIGAAVLVLGFLIVVHEFGHFLVAKLLGVGIVRFSVGFGPRMVAKTVGETEYALSAIPFGGYVKMVGEDPGGEPPADPRRSFSHQSLWRRAAIVVAGPGFNVGFAFLTFAIVFWAYGARLPSEAAKVGRVVPGMPAEAAGLEPGDVVVAVDGRPVPTWEALSKAIRASGGRPVTLRVEREGQVFEVRIQPREREERNLFGEVTGKAYLIGIERGVDRRQVGALAAVGMGASQTLWWVRTLLVSLVKIVQGRIPAREIGGPILIVQAAGEQARVGLEYLLHFMAVISINLGVLNLLPIPVLDGGHLFFFLLEAVMRRPLDLRHREIAQQIGLAILVAIMAFAFYNDIARVLRGWG